MNRNGITFGIAFGIFIALGLLARPAKAITVSIPCGTQRCFPNLDPPLALQFTVVNIGDCAGKILAFDQMDCQGTTLVSACIDPGEVITIDRASRDVRSILLVAIGTGSQARLDFTPIAEETVPSGTVLPFAGTTVPQGFLVCDGSEVSRDSFSRLFDRVGTTYGAGDGSTTFNLPDLTSRFPLGLSASGTGSMLGETGGEIDHMHEGASHTHGVPGHSHGHNLTASASGNHLHSISGTTNATGNHSHAVIGTTAVGGLHRHCFNAHQVGNYTNDNNNPPSGIVGHVQGGIAANQPRDITTQNGEHSHSFSTTSATAGTHNHSVSGTALSAGNHVHSIGGVVGNNGGGNGDQTLNTDPGTNGTTGIANPPFLTLRFIIKL